MDLDEALTSFGLSYTRGFRIRFNQFGCEPLGQDGIGIDDIQITGATVLDPQNVWVDFAYSGLETGSRHQPFNTLAEGVAAAGSGSMLRIQNGDTSETARLDKAMRIEAVDGPVRIGDPEAGGEGGSAPGTLDVGGVGGDGPLSGAETEDVRLLVRHFYLNVLAREPEAEAIEAWVRYFERALALRIDVRFVPREMAELFFGSAEYAGNARPDEAFILDCYRTFLLRDARDDDLLSWREAAWSRAEEVAILARSEEFDALIEDLFPGFKGVPSRNLTAGAFLSVLGRLPRGAPADGPVVDSDFSAGEIDAWARVLDTAPDRGSAVRGLVTQLLESDECLAAEPDARDRVVRLHRAVLGRFPTPEQTAEWTSAIERGALTVGQLADRLTESVEFEARVNDSP